MENDSSFEKQGLYHQAESSSPIKDHESPRYAFKIIRLNPGISPLNFVCCLINAIISVFALIIPSMLQPLILVDKNYFNISQNHAGSVTSLALFVDLIIKVLVLVPYGHCSDKLGRKVIIYYGAGTYLLGCAIMATQTSIFPGLVFAKILLANAAASFQAVPLLADYTADESKGRASGLVIMFIGLTTVVGNLYIKLLLHENLSLGRCYLITGMVVTLVLILSSFGLKKGRYHAPAPPSANLDELPPTAADLNSLEPSNSNVISTRNCMSILRKFKDAAKIFKERGWLQISLILQVAANSTQFVFFSYLALYVKSMFPDGTDDNTSNIAVNNIQTYTFIPTFFIVAAYGYLLDKPNKALKLAFLGIGGLATAFILIILSTSPDNLTLIFSALFIGAFMPGLFVLSNYLSIKNYPADKRGVMGGFIEMAANTSYFLISSLEGLLYDNWIKRGPFILDISLLGLAVLLIIIIYKRNIASRVQYAIIL